MYISVHKNISTNNDLDMYICIHMLATLLWSVPVSTNQRAFLLRYLIWSWQRLGWG